MTQLDLSAMARLNDADHSRMTWLEARYHWDRIDLALQWQRNTGRAASEYGALPQQQMLQTLFNTHWNRMLCGLERQLLHQIAATSYANRWP